MNAAPQFLLQSLIHQPVALDERQALKLGAHHQDAEVRLGSGGHGVHVALIVDLQTFRLESVGQFDPDGVLHGSPRIQLHVSPEAG